VRGQSLWDRVWAKVAIPENPHDCWEWNGARSLKRDGVKRPVIQVAGRRSPIKHVARVVCEWYQGPPPSSAHEAGHTCPQGENCNCVSPYHLVWMTRIENEQYKQLRRQQEETQDLTGTDVA
jgi:hypothetical protein